MGEAPTVDIVLCPFNYNKGCTKEACGIWDLLNSMCSLVSIAHGFSALVTILDAWPRPPKTRKPPAKKKEPRKE